MHFLRSILFLLFFTLQTASAQGTVLGQFTLGDTTSQLTVNDCFIGPGGTIYFTGSRVKDNRISLYISGVTLDGVRAFELFRQYGFDESGRFIRPYDDGHFLVCGHSEDTTGTFNIRLLKLANTGTVIWDTTFGNNGEGTMESPSDLAVDGRGNIYVAGQSLSDQTFSLLLKFSPQGRLLWSIRAKPFPAGTFRLHDIAVDAGGNIYGVSDNTFINDTSHGTVFKWDTAGNAVWRADLNMAFFESRPHSIAIAGDTLFVAGTPWTDKQNPVSIAVAAFRLSGELLSFKRIPLHSIQQGICDVRTIPGGRIAIVTETFTPPDYLLHTFVLSGDLSIAWHDSTSGPAPLRGRIEEIGHSTFDVVRYGALAERVRYTLAGGAIIPSAPAGFAAGGNAVDLVAVQGMTHAAVSRDQGPTYERVRVLVSSVSMTVARGNDMTLPSSLHLEPAYPNPFNPVTAIRFTIPMRAVVSLDIFDLTGKAVASLLSGEMESGTHTVRWNASGMASGVYLCRLQAAGAVQTAKLLLMR